jgi:hypothetical protein
MAKFTNIMLLSARKSDSKRVHNVGKGWSYSLWQGRWQGKSKTFTSRKGALHWVRNQRKKNRLAVPVKG